MKSGPLFQSRFRSQPGTLVLLPDRLVFVPINMRIAVAFGAIGMLIAQRAAARSAPARAAEEGGDKTVMPIAAIQAIEKGKHGLNRSVLVVTSEEQSLNIGVSYDEWAPAIGAVAESAGRRAVVGLDRTDFH